LEKSLSIWKVESVESRKSKNKKVESVLSMVKVNESRKCFVYGFLVFGKNLKVNESQNVEKKSQRKKLKVEKRCLEKSVIKKSLLSVIKSVEKSVMVKKFVEKKSRIYFWNFWNFRILNIFVFFIVESQKSLSR
jgi:hypothetical protein